MLSRRVFLAATASPLLPVGAAAAPPATPVLRRSVGTMGPDDPDLEAYRTAIQKMRALPASDPRSWLAQADIHKNHCPHRNWYFLPWHRAYLTAFERICRQMSGKADFALSYWDWTVDRLLPAPFRAGTSATNALNHPRPGFAVTDSLPDDMVGSDVINRILNSPDYESFGSTRPNGQNGIDPVWQRRMGQETELEFNPHDGLHGTLGGDMGQVTTSPRDPIFWLHHCNIDRIWASWVARGHSNSSEANWRNFRFKDQFFNPDKSKWDVGVSDLFSINTLGYRYGNDVAPATPNPALVSRLRTLRRLSPDLMTAAASTLRAVTPPGGAAIQVATADNSAVATRDRPLSIPVTLGRDVASVFQAAPLPQSGSQRAALAAAPQRVIATISGIEPPKDQRTRVRLFVNCDYLSPSTPLTDPHYVTSFSFFDAMEDMEGMEGHGDAAGKTVTADITAALSRAARAQQLQGDQIVVQLLPSGATSVDDTEIKPRRVQIAIV